MPNGNTLDFGLTVRPTLRPGQVRLSTDRGEVIALFDTDDVFDNIVQDFEIGHTDLHDLCLLAEELDKTAEALRDLARATALHDRREAA